MSHHIVELRDLTFAYPDGTKALGNISFRITHGESVGIVGPNGAGKTTLLTHLNGHILPQTGEVLVGEIPVSGKTREIVRRTVGIVFQNPDDQLFMTNVFEDVAFGPANIGLTGKALEDCVMDALKEVGCEKLADRPPHRLSGGQKKSVAIAGVLAMKPDILVMDEPSANLDPKSRKHLIKLLKGFHHTKIIASHDLDMILEVCGRCMVLNNGQLKADGRSKEILTDRMLMEDNGLELPLSALLSVNNCGQE